jgi:hypothetical protein
LKQKLFRTSLPWKISIRIKESESSVVTPF